MGVWHDSSIYCLIPIRWLTLDNQLRVKRDSLLNLFGSYWYVTVNGSGTKLLLVTSMYDNVSVGRLLEMDIATGQFKVWRDSTYNVSSARYLPGDSGLVYYSYGYPNVGSSPGYYRLDFNTGADSLILRYESDLGPDEVINGFDISADGRKLLFPLNHANTPPQAVELDIASKVSDTLNAKFDRQLLWLRYNPQLSQILFCNYPLGSGGSTVDEDSQIGVMDIPSMSKRVLDVNPYPGWLAVSLFPNWSADGKNIVYGSAKGPATEPPGAVSLSSLYILKHVN